MAWQVLASLLVPLLALLVLALWPNKEVSHFPREIWSSEPLASLVEKHRSRCEKPNRVVVTLSTFPGRLKRLKSTVQSLVEQSCPPDAIHVFVSDNPRTKKTGLAFKGSGDGIDEAMLSQVAALGEEVNVQHTKEDWGPGTKLLAALKVEQDPTTWLITVDDDTVYHKDTVLALVVAAKTLPRKAVPGFWCEEAWPEESKIRSRTLATGVQGGSEGTVHGWCGGFAGVLFKRNFFGEEIFNFHGAPDGCFVHDDVWFGGHLLTKGFQPYLITPGFISYLDTPTELDDRQDFSVFKITRELEKEGMNPQQACLQWFEAFRNPRLRVRPEHENL